MTRSKRLAEAAVLLASLGLGLAASAEGGVAYDPYPYDGYYDDGFLFFGGNFHDRHDFRLHHHHVRPLHGDFSHGHFIHDASRMHSTAGGFPYGEFHGGMGLNGGHGGGFGGGTVERIRMRKVAPSLSCPTVTAVWVVNDSFRLERAGAYLHMPSWFRTAARHRAWGTISRSKHGHEIACVCLQ